MSERDRLNRIVRVRGRILDVRRGALAEVTAAHAASIVRVERADDERRRAASLYLAGGEVTGCELERRAGLVAAASRRRTQLAAESKELAIERELRAGALTEAGRALRSVELLAQRREETERYRTRRQEQALSDDRRRARVAE